MIFGVENLAGFRGFQNDFLSDLTHLIDDFVESSMVGDSLFHFLRFLVCESASDCFRIDFSCPSPGAGWLRHNASLTEGFKARKLGGEKLITCFEAFDLRSC